MDQKIIPSIKKNSPCFYGHFIVKKIGQTVYLDGQMVVIYTIDRNECTIISPTPKKLKLTVTNRIISWSHDRMENGFYYTVQPRTFFD